MSNRTKRHSRAGKLKNQKKSVIREHAGTQKINEALELLDEVAKEKRSEINRLISEKYSNIQGIMDESKNIYRKTMEKTRQGLSEAVVHGEEKIKEISSGIDKKVHENPWLYIIISISSGFLLGYILGGSKRLEMKRRV